MARKNGFTLVELLVVIAIITILAAMLLPTLEKSLDAARTQKCANQLKQIAAACFYYAGESDGYIPTSGNSLTVLRPYLGTWYGAQYLAYGASRKPGDENMAYCPAFDRAHQLCINPSVPRPDINRLQFWDVTTYNFNMVRCGLRG